MKTHHFKAIYYSELGVIEQQFVRDWFDDHIVKKYTGRRFTDDMVILDDELIYSLIRKMNRLKNKFKRENKIDYILEKYKIQHCCTKTGTIV